MGTTSTPIRIFIFLSMWLLSAASPAALQAVPRREVNRAIDTQRMLLAEQPDQAALWNDLANLLLLADRLGEAEEAYDRSLELDPELISSRYNLALLYQQTDRPRRAKRSFKQVLKQQPAHAWSHYHLGTVMADSGDRKAAIKHFALALSLDARLTDPNFNPHILDNDLIASAVIKAYGDLPAADLAPRIYENRERVVASMLGSGESMQDKAKEKDREEAKARRREKRKQRKTEEKAEG